MHLWVQGWENTKIKSTTVSYLYYSGLLLFMRVYLCDRIIKTDTGDILALPIR